MPVSISSPDVLEISAEIGLTGASRNLLQCYISAIPGGFDPTYGNINDNDVLSFRNYDHTPSLTAKSLGDGANGDAACNDFDSNPTTRYMNQATFGAATELYTTSAGTTYVPSQWYSDGIIRRFFNGTTLGSGSSCP